MKKHSVLLKEELCEGCTNCVKTCPTKAIRVHNGKAMIKDELCIDCAECIRICAYHAKYSMTASFQDLASFKYPIALSKKTSEFLNNNYGIYISSSCPVVVRLIKILYPELTDHLIPFKAPVDIMAESARAEALARGIAAEDIGIYFITPCPGKNTNTFNPVGIGKSYIDQTIAVSEAYQRVLTVLETSQVLDKTEKPVPYLGLGWGQSGGEVKLLRERFQKNSLSISGIHRVKSLLDELSRNNVKGVKYFELAACEYGCVGGIFNVINPFQARHDLRLLRAEGEEFIEQDYHLFNYEIEEMFKPLQIGQLDSNLEKAMKKLVQLEKEIAVLPGLDCAACGAPDCRTLAEDIVVGMAKRSDCIFLLRKQVGDLADRMSMLVHELPPVMKRKKTGDYQDES